MKKYIVEVECLNLKLAKKVGKTVIDEIPEIKKFIIKTQEVKEEC